MLTDPLRTWRETVIEKMNPDSGILEKLLEEKILVEHEANKIKGKRTVRERNSKTLEYVTRRKQLKEFMKAVEETDPEFFDLITQLETADDAENVSNHRFARTVSKDRKAKKSNKTHKLRKSHKKKKHKVITSKTVNDLPVGVLDLILMKTILIGSTTANELSLTRHVLTAEVAFHLQCVRSSWHDRVNTSWFKTTLRRLLERPVCRLQKRIAVIDDWIYGVTKLRRTIYVLGQWSKSIRVYDDTIPFTLQSEIHLDGVKRPCDLAASDKNECLYISDSLCKCIWKVDVSDKTIGEPDAQRATLWLDTISSPYTLSVSRDGHVITVSWGSPSSLHIFGPEANSICRVPLPTDVEYPLHAVESSSGNLVVSHMWLNSWTWTISEVSRDGKVVRRFQPKDKKLLLNWPRHLALDPDDRVFVSDCENDRVIRIDSKLSSCDVLLTRGVAKIARPDRIHYDVGNGQLVVAHFEGQVNIFNLM